MPGGYGIHGPWGSAGTTSTPSPYSSPGGGNQGGPGHPGGYNPNLNPPVTVDYTSPVVNVSGNGNGNGVNTIDQVTDQEVIPPTQAELQTIQDAKVWEMAKLEASSDRYAKGWEGSEMIRKGKKAGLTEEQVRSSKTWIQKFGMPSIVSTPTYPQPGGEWEGIRSSTTGDYIYTGAGKALLDKGNITSSEDYEKAKGEYWKGRTAQEQFENQQQNNYGYDPGGGGGGYAGDGGYALGVKGFHRGRPENISPWARNIAGTPMLPVAGSGAGASMAAADELYALASGKKAFSMTPEEQGILALLNA